SDILAVTMPGFGTTGRTYNNAVNLCRSLGTELREISIVDACREHFRSIGHEESLHDVTYENSQARERTQILMDIANKHGGLVIGTGDLSEIAMGWSTYNGDHMSMYAVNCSVPKTLVRYLVAYAAEISEQPVRDLLMDVVNTPVSPELLPAAEDGAIKQKTEDIIGPYEVHDFYLYHFFKYGMDPEKLLFLASLAFGEDYPEEKLKQYLALFIRRFFTQQFKRSCSTDGPKVGSVALSPRGDWRMPSDASFELWKNILA
ncbi:MAG: NAD(+) synthase, partial [Lentisphaeria bacterium]|nr:NAD(+) synthase [Lentisphaeria bacterium]